MKGLVVTPKAHKLNISEDILKNIKPVYQISSSSQSSAQYGRKLVEGKWVDESTRDSRVNFDLVLRDANSGELIGKGQFECNPEKENREKFEENIVLKNILGQEVGTATLEVQKPKEENHDRSVEDEFRFMRKALHGMLRNQDRMWRDFHRGFFNDDFGFSMLENFNRPSLMIEDDFFPEFTSRSKRRGHQHRLQDKNVEINEANAQQESESKPSENKKSIENKEEKRESEKRDSEANKKKKQEEVEITDEKL